MSEPLRLAYRIECPLQGKGPFALQVLDSHRDAYLREGPFAMPQPFEDKVLRGIKHQRRDLGGSPAWRVGFPSVAELLRWFDARDLAACARAGQVFRVYACEWRHHTLYRTQIVFNRHHARLLRTLPILDLRTWFARDEERRAA